jgi:hypothetical protein
LVACDDWDGNTWRTPEMGLGTSVDNIEGILYHSIPHLMMNVHVRHIPDFSYRENGISFAIFFDGLEADVPTCRIESGEESLLTGNRDMTIETTELHKYAESIYYASIPMEMLRTEVQTT